MEFQFKIKAEEADQMLIIQNDKVGYVNKFTAGNDKKKWQTIIIKVLKENIRTEQGFRAKNLLITKHGRMSTYVTCKNTKSNMVLVWDTPSSLGQEITVDVKVKCTHCIELRQGEGSENKVEKQPKTLKVFQSEKLDSAENLQEDVNNLQTYDQKTKQFNDDLNSDMEEKINAIVKRYKHVKDNESSKQMSDKQTNNKIEEQKADKTKEQNADKTDDKMKQANSKKKANSQDYGNSKKKTKFDKDTNDLLDNLNTNDVKDYFNTFQKAETGNIETSTSSVDATASLSGPESMS